VAYFILKDQLGPKRPYYSIPYKLTGWKVETDLFFESLYEKNNLVILSRHIYSYAQAGGSMGPNGMVSTPEMEDLTEIIYLANGSINLMEYALVEKYSSSSLKGISKYKFKLDGNDQINSVSQTDMRYKILNKKAVQEITRSHY